MSHKSWKVLGRVGIAQVILDIAGAAVAGREEAS